jgi:hypothetical protein
MTNNNLSLKKIAAATGLFLGAFALSAFAGDWTPAGCAAPGCNTLAPINVGGDQFKSGRLAIGKDSLPANDYDLEVGGNANFTGSLLTTGISVSGLTNTLNLKVGGANANSSGYVLTNDGTGLAEWKAAAGSSTGFDSSFCYALRAGRWTRDGALSGYYLKGVTKSSDGNWDAHAGVYCLMKGSSDSRMTASVIQTLVNDGYLVVNSSGPVVGKTYNQIVDDCKTVDARPYAYGGTVICPLKDVFAN